MKLPPSQEPNTEINPKIDDDSPAERQIVVRRQNQMRSAKRRAKGGKELKVVESKRALDSYVMKTVIVSIVETHGRVTVLPMPAGNTPFRHVISRCSFT